MCSHCVYSLFVVTVALMYLCICKERPSARVTTCVSSIATLLTLYAQLKIHLKAELIFSVFLDLKFSFLILDTHLVASLSLFKRV